MIGIQAILLAAPGLQNPLPVLRKTSNLSTATLYARLALVCLSWMGMGFRTAEYFAVQSKVALLNESR